MTWHFPLPLNGLHHQTHPSEYGLTQCVIWHGHTCRISALLCLAEKPKQHAVEMEPCCPFPFIQRASVRFAWINIPMTETQFLFKERDVDWVVVTMGRLPSPHCISDCYLPKVFHLAREQIRPESSYLYTEDIIRHSNNTIFSLLRNSTKLIKNLSKCPLSSLQGKNLLLKWLDLLKLIHIPSSFFKRMYKAMQVRRTVISQGQILVSQMPITCSVTRRSLKRMVEEMVGFRCRTQGGLQIQSVVGADALQRAPHQHV